MTTQLIPIRQIVPNPQQSRREFDPARLTELAESIRTNGLLQPIVVEGPAENVYILIAGERRLRACTQLGWTEIEAVVHPPLNGSGSHQRAVLALVENLQRQNLSPIEEARAIQLLTELGLSNTEIARKLSTCGNTVAARLQLLQLPVEIQGMIEHGLWPIDSRATTAILAIPPEKRLRLAQKLARPGLTIKTVQSAVEKYLAALRAEKITTEPALTLAVRRSGEPRLPEWDALRQLGHLPPWSMLTLAVEKTCQTCALRDSASTVVCSSCPQVVLVSTLIEKVNSEKHGRLG